MAPKRSAAGATPGLQQTKEVTVMAALAITVITVVVALTFNLQQ
jgi:hypothetical protein